MLNKLSKNYSKTLLVIFLVAGIAPVVARTLPEVKFDGWQNVVSYIFSILAIVANTMISFFTNTETSDSTPTPKV